MKLRASKLSTDRIVGLSAMVVGVGSLFVILYQTHLMRQSQHASVLPYLMLAINANADGVHLTLRNAGIGPALIDDVRIRHQGRETVTDPHDFYVASRPDRQAFPLTVDRVVPGRLIPAGEWIQMLGVESANVDVEARGRVLDDLLRMFELAEVPRNWLTNSGIPLPAADRAVVEITYSSVYGDRWRVRSDRVVPEPY